MKMMTLLVSVIASAAAFAAVPVKWIVETSQLEPATFDVVRGESLSIEANFMSYGSQLNMGCYPCAIFWQTNGMGSAWWVSPARVSKPAGTSVSNIVTAVFTPQMDPGTKTVSGFIGSTGEIYRAAFTLRFRPGPGYEPNALPLPTPTIDCANVTFLNPTNAPWASGGGGGSVDAYTKAQSDARFAPTSTAETVSTHSEQIDQLSDEIISAKNYTANATNALAKVAHTGSYTDLTNKPTIPADPDYSTNNTALVTTITNLAPSKARGISLADPVRHCSWYQCVTNGVFFWLVEE